MDSSDTDPSGMDTSGMDPSGMDTSGMDPSGMDTSGTDPSDTAPPDPGAAVMALLAPGAPFEMAVEDVLGEPMQVFVQRARSLRELLAQAGRFGDSDYAVFHDGGRRRVLTFADHQRRVASVAAAMTDRGVAAGDRVAILAQGLRAQLADNLKLWSTIKHDLSHPENGLPLPLKAGLISLALFVERQSAQVLGGEAGLGVLVTINQSLISGLSGATPGPRG